MLRRRSPLPRQRVRRSSPRRCQTRPASDQRLHPFDRQRRAQRGRRVGTEEANRPGAKRRQSRRRRIGPARSVDPRVLRSPRRSVHSRTRWTGLRQLQELAPRSCRRSPWRHRRRHGPGDRAPPAVGHTCRNTGRRRGCVLRNDRTPSRRCLRSRCRHVTGFECSGSRRSGRNRQGGR